MPEAMTEIGTTHLRRLREQIETGLSLEKALPASIGNTVVSGGLWRFFSDTFPPRGIHQWNESSGWREHWKQFLPAGLFSFGEDVFGNQLIVVSDEENACLWNHEDGSLVDLLLAPFELLSTVAESGIGWIDFYKNGSLEIAHKYGEVPDNSQLHWVTPLVLGGLVTLENLSVIDREKHLIGHAKLWSRVQDLEPGATIHAKEPAE
jgi:hypothetical protein